MGNKNVWKMSSFFTRVIIFLLNITFSASWHRTMCPNNITYIHRVMKCGQEQFSSPAGHKPNLKSQSNTENRCKTS